MISKLLGEVFIEEGVLDYYFFHPNAPMITMALDQFFTSNLIHSLTQYSRIYFAPTVAQESVLNPKLLIKQHLEKLEEEIIFRLYTKYEKRDAAHGISVIAASMLHLRPVEFNKKTLHERLSLAQVEIDYSDRDLGKLINYYLESR